MHENVLKMFQTILGRLKQTNEKKNARVIQVDDTAIWTIKTIFTYIYDKHEFSNLGQVFENHM